MLDVNSISALLKAIASLSTAIPTPWSIVRLRKLRDRKTCELLLIATQALPHDRNLRRRAEEACYNELVPDSQFSHEQREAVLSSPDYRKLKDKLPGVRHLVDVQPEERRVVWRDKRYEFPKYRQKVKLRWALGYGCSYIAGWAPYAWSIFGTLQGPWPLVVRVLAAISGIGFSILCLYCLRQGARVNEANQLVADGQFRSSTETQSPSGELEYPPFPQLPQ